MRIDCLCGTNPHQFYLWTFFLAKARMRGESGSPKILESGNGLFQSSVSWRWSKDTWALGTRLDLAKICLIGDMRSGLHFFISWHSGMPENAHGEIDQFSRPAPLENKDTIINKPCEIRMSLIANGGRWHDIDQALLHGNHFFSQCIKQQFFWL